MSEAGKLTRKKFFDSIVPRIPFNDAQRESLSGLFSSIILNKQLVYEIVDKFTYLSPVASEIEGRASLL